MYLQPYGTVSEFIDLVFRENKPKTLIFNEVFWACFCENWVYKFGHWRLVLGYSVCDWVKVQNLLQVPVHPKNRTKELGGLKQSQWL
jgi:hypothetical protein